MVIPHSPLESEPSPPEHPWNLSETIQTSGGDDLNLV
jgi:hypothetical protein